MLVNKLNKNLLPNPGRVVLQFFFPGNKNRALKVIEKIMRLPESKVNEQLLEVMSMYSDRHKNYSNCLKDNTNIIERILATNVGGSQNRRLLIGSYFSKEYSIEAAALFNPSIVPHYEPSDDGTQKFIMSLRATGEGHISSIEFRDGIIESDGNVILYDESRYATMAKKNKDNKISKSFLLKKNEIENILTKEEIQSLPDEISEENLSNKKEKLSESTYCFISNLLDTNYACHFNNDVALNERVLFPISKAESMGMEDVRFVKFTDENTTKYYSTYTAYNGKNISSQLIETQDFLNYKIHSLHGKTSSDKGMGLFPRKIDGRYYMTSRIDGESIYMMSSDDVLLWNEAEKISTPEEPWEFIQLGNCGSPIEVEEGWLLLTHSVGAMRRYVMGALLLDKNNPSKIKAKLKKPLLEPDENEREGYVPNVVYSCGSIIHNNNLIIPYAVSDSASSFAKVNVVDLINSME